MTTPNSYSRSYVQTATDPVVQTGAPRPSARGAGRLEPDMWAGVEDTDPSMVLDVERGAEIEDVPPVGLVS